MSLSLLRRTALHSCAAAALLALCAPIAAQAQEQTFSFNIPAQALAPALNAFGRQSRQQVVFDGGAFGDRKSSPVVGSYTANQAINTLLAGTGFSARLGSRGEFVVAKATASGATDPTPERIGQVEEVIVTAQKKSEALLETPVPVTALDAANLATRNQTRLLDYFSTVPGLNVTTGSSGNGTEFLAIRGVTTGAASNPTVSVTIDDVPVGSSTFIGYGNALTFDLDPSDLTRVEVLKGPQGTLYGASSLGGLVKFVTNDPSTSALSGRVEVQGTTVQDGQGGYGARGAVNIPISDAFAVRVSAFGRRDPGYVDNIQTGQKDINRATVDGGRVSALWHPSDAISLKLNALFQETRGDGSSAVDATSDTGGNLHPVLPELSQRRLPGTEWFKEASSLYTANLNVHLGEADFASITGYGTNRYSLVSDVSGGSTSGTANGNGQFFYTNKFTQEFRLSSAGTHRIEWLAGAFYTYEDTHDYAPFLSINPATGVPSGLIYNIDYPSTLEEYALFGDLTVHFTDRFDVQFGGRASADKQVLNETDTGPGVPAYFGFSSPFVEPTETVSGHPFTYLITPRFKFSPNLMAYARFTSGYRVGGLNIEAKAYDTNPTYKPDTANNYELGFKGSLLDHRLTFDASVYYIDWKNIQITLFNPACCNYIANGSAARSEGVELSLQARPIQGLTIAATMSAIDAKLTQALPATLSKAVGAAGDRLPNSSPFSGSLSIDQDFTLAKNWTGFVGGTFAYVDERLGQFEAKGTPRYRFPAYSTVALRAGASYQAWTVNLFVNNVADTRGLAGGGHAFAAYPADILYIQPRTIGLSIAQTF